MAAAEAYGLDDLRMACYQFARRFINVKAVLPLLESTQGYSESELTQKLVAEVWAIYFLPTYKRVPPQIMK